MSFLWNFKRSKLFYLLKILTIIVIKVLITLICNLVNAILIIDFDKDAFEGLRVDLVCEFQRENIFYLNSLNCKAFLSFCWRNFPTRSNTSIKCSYRCSYCLVMLYLITQAVDLRSIVWSSTNFWNWIASSLLH